MSYPDLPIAILSLTVLLSAILAIIFRQKENHRLYAIFKPLTTILIISIALIVYYKTSTTYSGVMIIALAFSLLGDVFLLKSEGFLLGLASFLVAHIFFTIGFAAPFGFSLSWIPLVFLLPIAGFYYIFLRSDLKKYSIPVLIYMIVIIGMNWQAIGLALIGEKSIYLFVASASILFSFSDAVLAFNKFKKSFKWAEVLILSTYWTSIYLFAMAGLYLAN